MSEFDSYAREAYGHLNELLAALTDDEVEHLRQKCSEMGRKAVVTWYGEHFEEVFSYVRATPSERKKKKAWQSDERKGLLVLAAATHAKQACVFLDTLTRRVFGPGMAYRHLTAVAGDVYFDVLLPEIPDWPFPQPSPFAE